MRPAPRLKNRVRTMTPVLLALLLAIALLPAAALAAPPPLDGDPPPTNQQQSQNPPPSGNQPPPTNQQQSQNPPPSGNQPPPTNQQQSQNPPPSGNQPPPTTNQPTSDGGGQDATPHPDAPSYPSADCIVAHAATPAQLCPVAGGLQYYFIGKDGSTSIGPFISPFADLAALYTAGTAVRLYTGSNPLTGKSVHIDYLPADRVIRVSTYYPDTQYDTNKPYTFTVNGSNSVSHIAW